MNEETLFGLDEQFFGESELAALDTVETSQFLIFLTDNLKIGVDANQVVEIITSYSITFLPMLPDFVRGIINLRGQMIPILDMRLRLGKDAVEDCLIVVLNVSGTQIGILVDSVDQMLDIPKEDILPTPVNHNQKLVSGMVTLPDGSGTMMVLDCEELLPHD